jgi:hypothetical protein
MHRTSRSALLAATALLSWMVPSMCRAGNDEGILLGNDAALAAGAVTATAGDGGALQYNVALIGAVRRSQLDASGNLFLYRINEVPQLLRATSGETAGVSGLEVNAVPSALTFLRRLGDGVTAGFGLFVTDATAFSQRAVLEAMGPPASRFRIDTTEVVRNWHGTLGFGFELGPELRLGFRLYLDAENRQVNASFWGDYAGGTGATEGLIGVSVRSNLDLVGIGAGLGLHWAPGNGFELGLSVLSPRLDLAASYSVSEVVLLGRSDTAGAGLLYEPTDETDLLIDVASQRPLVVRLGLAYRWARGWIALDGDLRTPNLDDRVRPRNVSANVRLGTRVLLDETWSVGGGLFTDLSPYPGLRIGVEGTGERRLDFVGATFGAAMRNRVSVSDTDQASDIIFVTTVAARYAYGWGQGIGLLAQVPPDFSASLVPIEEVLGPATTHELSLHVGSGMEF